MVDPGKTFVEEGWQKAVELLRHPEQLVDDHDEIIFPEIHICDYGSLEKALDEIAKRLQNTGNPSTVVQRQLGDDSSSQNMGVQKRH